MKSAYYKKIKIALVKKKVLVILFILSAGISFFLSAAFGLGPLKWFTFNREDALREWKEKIFQGRVLYTVNPDKDNGYVLAKSDKASSGLFYTIKYSPKTYPYISWNWKVSKFPSKTKSPAITKKSWIERDDYAVRVYVIFPAFIFTNTKCLEYVWSEYLPSGTILTSPFFKNIKLIVLESGSEKVEQWISEERNVLEDYKKAFGRMPSGNVGAVAIMTDADNTQSSAEAYYSDIKVGYIGAIAQADKKEAADLKPKGGLAILEYIKSLLKQAAK